MNTRFHRSLLANVLVAAAVAAVPMAIGQTLDQSAVVDQTTDQAVAAAPATAPSLAASQSMSLSDYLKLATDAHAAARTAADVASVLPQIDAQAWTAYLSTDSAVNAADPTALLQLTTTVARSLETDQQSQLATRLENRFVKSDATFKALDNDTFNLLSRSLGSLGWARDRRADLSAQWMTATDTWKQATVAQAVQLNGSLRGGTSDAAKQAQQAMKQQAESTYASSGALAQAKLEDAKQVVTLMGGVGWTETQQVELTASWMAASSDWRTATPRALSGLVDRLKSSDSPTVKQAKQQLRGYLEANYTSTSALGQMDMEGIRRFLPMMEMVGSPKSKNSDYAAAWMNASDAWTKTGPTLLDFYSQFLTGTSDQTKQAQQKLRQYLENKYTTVDGLKTLDLQATRRMLKMLGTFGMPEKQLGEIAIAWITAGGTFPERYDNNVSWFMDYVKMAPADAFDKAKGQLAQNLTAPDTTIRLTYSSDFREARSATPLDPSMRDQLNGLLLKQTDGSAPELPAILLAWDAKQRNKLNDWMNFLNQKIAAQNTNPDATASWYMAAAYARRIDSSMPALQAGMPFVQKAMAIAQSEPLRLSCVEYMFWTNVEIEKFDQAKQILADAPNKQQLTSDASKTRLAQLALALPRQQATILQADRNRAARNQDKQLSDRLAFLQQRYDEGVKSGASQQQLTLLQRMINDAKSQMPQ